ncbi:MAG: translation elongation factor Ts [Thermaerobacter sp.]|nr:translation elongation factor Ts [Thermaerobacter sp.]
MAVTAADVKQLRARTGAGMLDCKKALEETGGDLEQAVAYLRERGLAKAAQKAGRQAKEGLVEAYIHAGGRIGALVELNCETDFVAKTDEFRTLAHDLAMQVAATSPRYLDRARVPEAELAAEREILAAQARQQGKPETVVERMVQGRLEKFYQENCLLEQPFIKDPDRTVEELLKEAIAVLKENVVLRRFVRFGLGEEQPGL